MKKGNPIALDPDMHSLLDVIGGFGAVVAVGIIAMLSVCAAFLIYRSFRGQRVKADENNGKKSTASTGEGMTNIEKDDRPTESTAECQDRKQKMHQSDTSNLSATNSGPLSTETPEKDLNESTHKDVEEITDELLTDLEPDKTDSDLDPCLELDTDENTECEDRIQLKKDDEVLAAKLDCQLEETEEYFDKGRRISSLDTDEPSETESALDNIYQIHQDHHNCSDQSGGHKPSKIHLEADIKITSAEGTSKKFEDHHDWRFPRTNNFDSCCCDRKKGQPWFQTGSYTTDAISLSPAVETMVNHCNRFEFHNYLGFQTDNTFMGGSSTQVSLSQDKKTSEEGAEIDAKHKKNEISIMDAIMDNNEWLNVGAAEFKDRPWLAPTASLTEDKQEGQIKTGLAKDDDELANKRVATVPPLSQVVSVTFRIHYITHSPLQLVAVTGSLQELGAWESFIPLQRAKDGFWANTVSLPVESQVEWKFVLVDDGRISRWEECENRYLCLTSQDEEVYLDKCWGCC